MVEEVASPDRPAAPGIAGALAWAGALALGIGTVVQVVVLGLAGAGQGSVIVIFDWMFAPVWGLVLLVGGRWAARRALRSGRFGPVACTVSGIVLVAAVALLCFALSVGLPPDPESYWVLLYAAHIGMVYGSLAGFLFWRIVTGREPRLLPAADPRRRRQATLVFAGFMVVYMVLPAVYLSI